MPPASRGSTMQELATAFEPSDRFGQSIKRIVDGEKDWPASKATGPAELEAQRRSLAHELFAGAEHVDLVAHSTPIRCCLKLGDWVLGPAEAEQLASYLPESVKIVRLIGCCTASTEDGRAAAAALTRRGLEAYGTLNKVYASHFDKDGVRCGIEGPELRGFFPDPRGDAPRPAPRHTPEGVRSGGRLARIRRGVWKVISRLYRQVIRLFPTRGEPRSRIVELLGPKGVPMPGLLTEPLLVFEIASSSGPWTLEILFDFEHARFYPSAAPAEERDLVYEIRGFGQAKTPLEAYLERRPRGVTLIHCHEEAADRCGCTCGKPPPPPGPDAAQKPEGRWRRVVLAGVASAVLVLVLGLGLLASDRLAAPSPAKTGPAAESSAADPGSVAVSPEEQLDGGGAGLVSPAEQPVDGGSDPAPPDSQVGGGGGGGRGGGGGGSPRPISIHIHTVDDRAPSQAPPDAAPADSGAPSRPTRDAAPADGRPSLPIPPHP